MKELLGFVAMLLVNLAYLPQLIKTIRHKEVKSFSLGFILCLHFGFWLYLAYAVWIMNPVYIVSNLIALTGNGALLICYLKYR